MMKTVVFSAYLQEPLQKAIDLFWEQHPRAQLLAQSQSECYLSDEEEWSLTVCLTVKEDE
jgi:hypothetical protein